MNTKSDITVYAFSTPNGLKLPIALEEIGVEYELISTHIGNGDQFKPEYIKLNPNSKIPTIVDNTVDGGFSVFESGAELLYIAEKYNKLIPQEYFEKQVVLQWLFFQNASFGPYLGQFGHFFKYAPAGVDHSYSLNRYTKEAKRLLKVLDDRLAQCKFLGGPVFSIADISTYPWIYIIINHYKASEILDMYSYEHIMKWYQSCIDRPSFEIALKKLGF